MNLITGRIPVTDHQPVPRELARDAVPARLFRAEYSRNAWLQRGASVPNSYGFENILPTLADTKSWVESRRVQGSKWTIVEIAACAFIGQTSSLIVTSGNAGSFSGYPAGADCTPYLDDIARSFDAPG